MKSKAILIFILAILAVNIIVFILASNNYDMVVNLFKGTRTIQTTIMP